MEKSEHSVLFYEAGIHNGENMLNYKIFLHINNNLKLFIIKLHNEILDVRILCLNDTRIPHIFIAFRVDFVFC